MSEMHRADWRETPLPSLYPETEAERRALLAQNPATGSVTTRARCGPISSHRVFVPAEMTADQVRDINALTHIENELIDEACGRVLDWLEARGQLANTDVFFTTDHGELQGDFGLLFKGPYHVDALMRLPFIGYPPASRRAWRSVRRSAISTSLPLSARSRASPCRTRSTASLCRGTKRRRTRRDGRPCSRSGIRSTDPSTCT